MRIQAYVEDIFYNDLCLNKFCEVAGLNEEETRQMYKLKELAINGEDLSLLPFPDFLAEAERVSLLINYNNGGRI